MRESYKRWALIGALIADVAVNVLMYLDARKRDKAWERAEAEEVEKARAEAANGASAKRE